MTNLVEIKVPDVGNVAEIDVVEVLIKPGDVVALEQTVAALETDKASMDLPSSAAGTVQEVFIKRGRQGFRRHTDCDRGGGRQAKRRPRRRKSRKRRRLLPKRPRLKKPRNPYRLRLLLRRRPPTAPCSDHPKPVPALIAHASPSVRLFARELGVDIAKVTAGTGRKGRILKDDVKELCQKSTD